jgi:UDP-N-acetylmuramate dehydrogenase
MSKSTVEARLAELSIPFATEAAVHSTLLSSRAELVVIPDCTQMASLLPLLEDEGMAYKAHGAGSNTLLLGTDAAPIRTVLISTKHMRGVRADADTGIVEAGGGVNINAVSKFSARVALSGLEFACDVPGSTAGAIATDAWHPIHTYREAFRREGLDESTLPYHISSVLLDALLITPDGEQKTMTPGDLGLRNRTSRLLDDENRLILLSARFGLQPDDSQRIFQRRAVVCEGRREMRARNKSKNPHSTGRTLGYSFVMDHPGYDGRTATELIASSESLPPVLSVDGMFHSKTTPNIICNTGGGVPDAYLRIADQIQQAVADEHGVEMPLEVKIIK